LKNDVNELSKRNKHKNLKEGSGSGMGKKLESGSGMNNPDHISESLDTNFWVKNT
jgi:hypothetical protein